MLYRIVVAVSGLTGASGVILAAVAAHVAGATNVATAAYFLLFHAAAALALAALPQPRHRLSLPLAAAGVLLLGAVLFSADVALRQLAGFKLLWGTAPAGGSLAIVGWLIVVAAAVATRRPA
jgi:uncharacterized membrane protein YgdD (TMEM256/DUF423 family)